MSLFSAQTHVMQVAVVVVALAGLGISACGTDSASGTGQAQSAGPTATAKTPAATRTPQVAHYPPTTRADLQGLAAKGTASAIHEVHSESVGLVGVCPEPKREVLVDPSVTGQQLAEDLLAYFYGQQLANPCGSLVVAYNHQSEVGDAYTAGRINLDVVDSSGQENTDPNASNLTYTLTLDIGGVVAGPREYTVTYH